MNNLVRQKSLEGLMDGIKQYLQATEDQGKTSCTIDVDAIIMQTAYTFEEFQNDKLLADLTSDNEIVAILKRLNLDSVKCNINNGRLSITFTNSDLHANFGIRAMFTDQASELPQVITDMETVKKLLHENQEYNQELLNELENDNYDEIKTKTSSSNIVNNIINNLDKKFNNK